MEAILHIYHPKRRLLLLEYANRSGDGHTAVPHPARRDNVLLFVGGLYDTFRSPSYVDDLAALFPQDVPRQKWRVMHVQLSSAGKQWGLYDLNRDVDEIGAAIAYIRSTVTLSDTSPVVLMGHSTGCQDLMHYLVSPTSASARPRVRPVVSGAILQAPVSDREAILHDVERQPATRAAYQAALAIATTTPADKHTKTVLPLDLTMPLQGTAPVTVARFLSMASPDSPARPSLDDYFSSDLSDERLTETFGAIGQAPHLRSVNETAGASRCVLILPSGADEHVNPGIDKARLLARWRTAIESSAAAALSPHSLIVPNGIHDLSGTSVAARVARLVDTRRAVLSYLDDVVGGVDGGTVTATATATGSGPWAIWEQQRQEIEAEAGMANIKL